MYGIKYKNTISNIISDSNYTERIKTQMYFSDKNLVPKSPSPGASREKYYHRPTQFYHLTAYHLRA